MNGDDEARERFERARRMRNIAIASALFFLVVLFFLMTVVRLGGQTVN